MFGFDCFFKQLMLREEEFHLNFTLKRMACQNTNQKMAPPLFHHQTNKQISCLMLSRISVFRHVMSFRAGSSYISFLIPRETLLDPRFYLSISFEPINTEFIYMSVARFSVVWKFLGL